jgi:hypothetical protein
MTLASVQGETFLIPVGATGVLSTLTNWQQLTGQKVVDLTEMIDKRLLRYVLLGAQHLLSHSEVQFLDWETLSDLHTQFDFLGISPLPSVHQVASDFFSRFHAQKRASKHASNMKITGRNGSLYAQWTKDGIDWLRMDGMEWTETDANGMTRILCTEGDRIQVDVFYDVSDVQFPLRVGPFHGLRLRDAGLGERRGPTADPRLRADLELYDATEFRTRPTSPLSRPSKQRERKRKINRVVVGTKQRRRRMVVYDTEDDD